MDIAQTIPIAYWSMHSGSWWIVGAVVMMGFMGAMMWMMMRGMAGGSKRSSAPSESPPTTESPVEILERRFAEGEISVEDYRQRRETLTTVTDRGQPAAGNGKPDAVPAASRQEEP